MGVRRASRPRRGGGIDVDQAPPARARHSKPVIRASPLSVWLLAALLALAARAPLAAAARVAETRPLMGTIVSVIAEGADEAALRAAIEDAYAEMSRLSDMMNRYDPASVVSAINDAAGEHPVRVPPQLMTVLKMARRVSERTHGAFDVTVGGLRGWRFRREDPSMPTPAEIAAQLPRVDYRKLVLDERAHTAFLARRGMRIDLGGIAKLYILEAGVKRLERRGVTRALDKLLGVLEIRRGIVASSGDYERYFLRDGRRYHHVLDPRTGYPSEGPRGVTLVSENLEALDGLGVAIMVLGKQAGIKLVEQTRGLDALIVERDGSVWMTPGMRARLHE